MNRDVQDVRGGRPLDDHGHAREGRADPDGGILPTPVLFGAYAVRTRPPPPWRLRADVAERLLRDTFSEHATVVSLPDEEGARSVVRSLAQRGLIGGIAHDVHVAACAQAAGASALATLNGRDFARLDLGAMAWVVP